MHFYVSGVNSDISFLLFGSLSLYGSSVVVRFKHSIGVVCASERLFLLSLLLSRFLSLSLSPSSEFDSSLADIGAGHSLDMTNIEIICCHSVHIKKTQWSLPMAKTTESLAI